MNRSDETALKKRLKNREDMFLRRLFAMLARMAKADGKVDAWETHAAERALTYRILGVKVWALSE